MADREKELHNAEERADEDERKADEERKAEDERKASEPVEPTEEDKAAEEEAAADEANELAMSKMAEIAASQPELYDPAELARLGMDRAQGLIKTPDDYRAKLESIHINPKPIATGLSNEGDYSLSRAVDAVAHGKFSDAPVESCP